MFQFPDEVFCIASSIELAETMIWIKFSVNETAKKDEISTLNHISRGKSAYDRRVRNTRGDGQIRMGRELPVCIRSIVIIHSFVYKKGIGIPAAVIKALLAAPKTEYP